jgi:hypothetical protein
MTLARSFVFLGLVASAGCSSGPSQVGASEPFQVRASQSNLPAPKFIKGALPGRPPPDGGSVPPAGDAAGGPPTLTVFQPPAFVLPGQSSATISGQTSLSGYAVGIKLDVGTGYWVFPVGTPDLVTNNPAFQVFGDFSQDIVAGEHDMSAVAFDQNGDPGPQRIVPICIESRVPDGFNSCLPKDAPPNAVISLTWDTPVDLDLQVLTPSGLLVDSKHPLITEPNDAGVLPRKIDGIDRDSNPACNIDGINTEDLVWNATVPHGSYGIYVNLFSACGQQVVHFQVSVYSAVNNRGTTGSHLQRFYDGGGVIPAIDANGGTARGLYVTQFVFK